MNATDIMMPVLGGERVLVVDAVEDSAAALTAMLRLNGFDARAATSVSETLAAAHKYSPNVVILDPALPHADWRKLVRRLQAASAPPKVIVLTGDTAPATRQAATEAGAVAFLLKPAEPTDVVKLLHSLNDNRAA